MEFYYFSPSETFVVLTADQFDGCDDGLLEQQKLNRVLTTKAIKSKKMRIRNIHLHIHHMSRILFVCQGERVMLFAPS